jgi:hypothetical protein
MPSKRDVLSLLTRAEVVTAWASLPPPVRGAAAWSVVKSLGCQDA